LVEAFGGRVPAALEAALRRDLAAVLELASARMDEVSKPSAE
jgi:hypothetical protein